MRKQSFKRNVNSIAIITLVAMFGLGLILMSCNKSGEKSDLTEDDAYDVVSGTLDTASYGLTANIAQASMSAEESYVYTSTPTLQCGILNSDTLSAVKSTATYSYDYLALVNYKLTCTTIGLPSAFEFDSEVKGNYSTTIMSSDDSFNSKILITDLEPSSKVATVNGSYTRSGTQASKVRNQRSITSTVSYTLTNLELNKSVHKIEGGSATLNISLTSENITKIYSAVLTFNGDYTATLNINGKAYNINL